jgi:hypothetical protein
MMLSFLLNVILVIAMDVGDQDMIIYGPCGGMPTQLAEVSMPQFQEFVNNGICYMQSPYKLIYINEQTRQSASYYSHTQRYDTYPTIAPLNEQAKHQAVFMELRNQFNAQPASCTKHSLDRDSEEEFVVTKKHKISED